MYKYGTSHFDSMYLIKVILSKSQLIKTILAFSLKSLSQLESDPNDEIDFDEEIYLAFAPIVEILYPGL